MTINMLLTPISWLKQLNFMQRHLLVYDYVEK